MIAALSRPLVNRLGLIAFGLAVAVVVVDQASKHWIVNVAELEARGHIPVFPPFFNLTWVLNTGVSFGLLAADGPLGRWALTGFSALVVTVLAFWARKVDRLLTALALGLIMGGAIGNNLIDRVRYGGVVDFLDFKGLWFPWVFNVADSAITIGVILLLVDSLFPPKPASPPAA